jgi:hypothetical protein
MAHSKKPAEPAATTKMGRPTAYKAEIAAMILEQLSSGKTLREICRDEGFPSEGAVRGWAVDDREGFAALYQRAREIGCYAIADEIIEVADDGSNDWMERNRADGTKERVIDHEHVSRSRLRVDAKKWLLSKMLPNVFGERVAQQMLGRDGKPVDPASPPGMVFLMDLGDGCGARPIGDAGE